MLEPERESRAVRELQALCREVAGGDPEAFAQALVIRDRFDAMLRMAALGQRAGQGYSWADLARPLGLTRQAVAQRYRTVDGDADLGRGVFYELGAPNGPDREAVALAADRA